MDYVFEHLNNNSILVVLIIVLLLWSGIFIFLMGLNKKVKELEKLVSKDDV